MINAGDWDRDGAGDVIARGSDGALWLYRGNGAGQLAEPTADRRRASVASPASRRSAT